MSLRRWEGTGFRAQEEKLDIAEEKCDGGRA